MEQQALGGFRDVVYTSFESGDINFTAEYAASALEFLNGGKGVATRPTPRPRPRRSRTELKAKALVALEAAPAVDSNSFVVTAETASAKGLKSVSDLTDDLRLGGPPDCPENASCLPGLEKVYGLDLSGGFTPLDGGGPLTVAALEGGEIDVAILFITDGTIAEKKWVVLADDKGLINADNVIPVTSDAVAEAYGDDFTALVNKISAAMTTAELTELNRRVTHRSRGRRRPWPATGSRPRSCSTPAADAASWPRQLLTGSATGGFRDQKLAGPANF